MSSDIKKTDWKLLIFLLLFTNQAVFSVKILGLILIYVLRPNFKFRFKQDRLPKFYVYILGVSLITLLVKTREFSTPYLTAFAVGNFFWIAGFLAIHQIKLSIERYGTRSIYNVLRVFTVLNFAACLWQLWQIMQITHTLNPYSGLDFPYGMSTGDNIFGIFLQNSYYNMMVSAILAVYFIYKRDFVFVILSSMGLILVFGNYGTMVFLAGLSGLTVAGIANATIKTSLPAKWAKILTNIAPPGNFLLYVPLLVVFILAVYASLSPENTKYVVEKLEDKVYAINTNKQDNYATMISNQKMDPRAFEMRGDEFEIELNKERSANKYLSYSEAITTTQGKDETVREDAKRSMTKAYIEKLQGKTLALLETWQYLKSSPANLMLGAGTTRFASLTAQKMAGYDSSRLFMSILPHYIAPEYQENHLLIIEERRTAESKYFSNANWPDSFYNQLPGEYGLAGILVFLVFYAWYFVKRIDKWTYSIWVFIMILPFAHLTYLFEALCVIPFFEMLLLADIKQQEDKINVDAG